MKSTRTSYKKTFRNSSMLRRAICLALIPSLTGCTSALWTPACATRAVHPHIEGIVRNYPAMGSQSLVVTYRAPLDGTDVNLVVPLDSNFAPLPPFAAVGQAHVIRHEGEKNCVEVAASLDQKQLAAILASGKSIVVDRNELSKHFNSADWSPAREPELDWPGAMLDQQGTACVLAFRSDSSGLIVPVGVDSAKQPDGKVVLDPGVHVVLVPTVVDRPPGDQTRNKVVAVVLTPVAVAGDLAGAAVATGAVCAVLVVAVPVIAVVAFFHPQSIVVDNEASHERAHPSARPATVEVPICPHGE